MSFAHVYSALPAHKSRHSHQSRHSSRSYLSHCDGISSACTLCRGCLTPHAMPCLYHLPASSIQRQQMHNTTSHMGVPASRAHAVRHTLETWLGAPSLGHTCFAAIILVPAQFPPLGQFHRSSPQPRYSTTSFFQRQRIVSHVIPSVVCAHGA